MTTEWTHDDHQSWRWKRSFAFLPVKTFDAGWIWMRSYWRWQSSNGWGFFDDYPYLAQPDDLPKQHASMPSQA